MAQVKDNRTTLSLRLSKKLRRDFHRTAKAIGTPADVHREILEAFVDGRLTIHPTDIQKEIYK